MGAGANRLWHLLVQIAAVVVMLITLEALASLLVFDKVAIDDMVKSSGVGANLPARTMLIGWSLIVAKECLTFAVAAAAFWYAQRHRRSQQAT